VKFRNADKSRKLKGIPVSPGIIIGKARLVDRSKVKLYYQYLIRDEQVSKEADRFREALNITREQIISLKSRMQDQIQSHAFILDAQLMILNDSMLSEATVNTIIHEKINAEWALQKSVQTIRQLFDEIDDDYIRERAQDVEDVAERIMRNLAGEDQASLSEISERVIIVAHELSPMDTSEMNIGKVMGFITDVGGRTSHTAIMAKALKIPAVVGLEAVTRQVKDGELLVVDGNTGEVVINPDDEAIILFQERQIRHERYESAIARTSHLPAETVDGRRISIKANIEFLEEVVTAKDYGAEGIGLYRTEFLYLRSKGVPNEEELFEDYREVAEIIAPDPITIRTLDLGGDKFSSDLELNQGMNPALGLRAIRFCLREPQIFKSQLRAIFRASAYGRIRLMFPMISGLQEVLDTKMILDQVKDELDKENLPYDPDVQIGVMIEVPSAVAVSDLLARHVDFFSLGTNDLIQYSLAIDRINEHVAFMYQPFHPAIIRMLRQAVQAAREAGIEIALCGEMAGDPLCVFILLGLGIEELSMNAGSIPIIKQLIRCISMEDAKRHLQNILELSTAQSVREYLIEKMKALSPDLEAAGLYE
jgi:phosphotransferase system enzyme I (PtsI)